MGYINKDLVDGGQLLSASFLNPGKETFKVSDIKITGYEEDPSYYYAQDYYANFYILDYAGRTVMGKDAYFEYLDSFDWDNGFFLGGKWSNNGSEIVPGGENDFEMSAGQAIWFSNPGGGENTFTFGTAGEVIQHEVTIPLVDGGNSIGNPMAAPVWVSSLTVTGYEDDPSYYYAQDYYANFYILDYAGRTIMGKDIYFEYLDSFDWDNGVFLGGVWTNNGADITPKGENDFQIPAGVGLWFSNPGGGENQFSVIFPQVVGEQAAK